MGARSRSAKVRGAARKSVATAARGRKAAAAPQDWAQSEQVPEERDDEIDCQRIVEGYGGRNLPPYYDDYN